MNQMNQMNEMDELYKQAENLGLNVETLKELDLSYNQLNSKIMNVISVRRMNRIKNNQNEQQGGSSSWMNNWYSQSVVQGNHALSKWTLERIDNSPMFNPLKLGTEIPTPTSGIIPEGLWLAGQPPDLNKLNKSNSN